MNSRRGIPPFLIITWSNCPRLLGVVSAIISPPVGSHSNRHLRPWGWFPVSDILRSQLCIYYENICPTQLHQPLESCFLSDTLGCKPAPLFVVHLVQHKPLSEATGLRREGSAAGTNQQKITPYFPVWKHLNRPLYCKTSVSPFSGKTWHWGKGIGSFIRLIPNSCLIAAVSCAIRPWWAAQSRALEEWKIKQIYWSKIPFIVLMISRAKGVCQVERKMLWRDGRRKKKRLLFPVSVNQAVLTKPCVCECTDGFNYSYLNKLQSLYVTLNLLTCLWSQANCWFWRMRNMGAETTKLHIFG